MTIVVVNMITCNPPWGQHGDVRIDRKTKWGNPHPLFYDTPANRQMVLSKYEEWLSSKLDDGSLDISELFSAKRLGCWCKPKPCHGDIIKRKIEAALKSEQKTLSV